IKGNGTVVGPMSISGTVAPGASAGTLTANGAVTMQNSSVYSWELNNSAPAVGAQNTGNSESAGLQDKLAITGGTNTLTAGNIVFKVTELTTPTFTFGNNYSWTVATTQATPTLGTVTFDTTAAPVITAWGGAAKLALTVSGNNVYLN